LGFFFILLPEHTNATPVNLIRAISAFSSFPFLPVLSLTVDSVMAFSKYKKLERALAQDGNKIVLHFAILRPLGGRKTTKTRTTCFGSFSQREPILHSFP